MSFAWTVGTPMNTVAAAIASHVARASNGRNRTLAPAPRALSMAIPRPCR